MMNFSILNTIGNLTPQARIILEETGDISDFSEERQQNVFDEKIENYNVVLLGLGLTMRKETIDRAKNLKIIATATTGLDHIDVDYAKSRGIEVLSLRGETEFLDTITGTAELTMGLLIDLVRYTPWAFDDVKNYKWEREKFRGHNLYVKTLGIVGMGRLGKWMARYGKVFGMNVVYYDPHVETDEWGTKASFDELLKKSDAVSIHVHLTPETENLFNKKTLMQMKKGAYLINTSRGKIVDEVALLEVLENSYLGGYGTDVLADELYFEKGFYNHPLVEYAKKHRNIVIVPHIGGMTAESRERTDIFMAQKVKNFLQK